MPDAAETCSAGRDSPVDVSSTSSEGGQAGASGRRSPGTTDRNNQGSNERSAPATRNPLLQERWTSEELRHVTCHLETKDLWDKFNDLGTEMIITKTGR